MGPSKQSYLASLSMTSLAKRICWRQKGGERREILDSPSNFQSHLRNLPKTRLAGRILENVSPTKQATPEMAIFVKLYQALNRFCAHCEGLAHDSGKQRDATKVFGGISAIVVHKGLQLVACSQQCLCTCGAKLP